MQFLKDIHTHHFPGSLQVELQVFYLTSWVWGAPHQELRVWATSLLESEATLQSLRLRSARWALPSTHRGQHRSPAVRTEVCVRVLGCPQVVLEVHRCPAPRTPAATRGPCGLTAGEMPAAERSRAGDPRAGEGPARLLGDPGARGSSGPEQASLCSFQCPGFCLLGSPPFPTVWGFPFPLSVSPTGSPGCSAPCPLSSRSY